MFEMFIEVYNNFYANNKVYYFMYVTKVNKPIHINTNNFPQ